MLNQTKGQTMHWDEIEGNWIKFKGDVKQQWQDLTDEQLEVIAGKREHLAEKIQVMYGVDKNEAENQLSDWQKMQ